MANVAKIEVIGKAEVERFFKEAPQVIVARTFVRSLSAATNVYAAGLIREAPIKAEDTGGILDRGELKESVSVAVHLDSQLRGGVGTAYFRGKAANAVANWIEFGHRIVGHRPKKEFKGKVTKPNPFIRRVAETETDAALAAFTEEFVQGVNSEYGR